MATEFEDRPLTRPAGALSPEGGSMVADLALDFRRDTESWSDPLTGFSEVVCMRGACKAHLGSPFTPTLFVIEPGRTVDPGCDGIAAFPGLNGPCRGGSPGEPGKPEPTSITGNAFGGVTDAPPAWL